MLVAVVIAALNLAVWAGVLVWFLTVGREVDYKELANWQFASGLAALLNGIAVILCACGAADAFAEAAEEDGDSADTP